MTSRFDALPPGHLGLPPELVAELQSPALIISLDHVRENVRRVLAIVGDPGRWRVHLKTTKMPEIWSILIDAGVRTFKCATTREAHVLLELLGTKAVRGADLLVAYTHVQPALSQLAEAARRFPQTRVAVLSEDPEHAQSVPDVLGVFVDVNPGMNRTGIPIGEQERIAAVVSAAGDRLRGIHHYEGHLHTMRAVERTRRAYSCFDRLVHLVTLLRGQQLAIDEIVTSGTPTFQAAMTFPGFRALEGTMHRVSPGTVVLHDYRSEQEIEDLDLLPAAAVFSRVISFPAPLQCTCDAGSKSIAAEAGDPCAYVFGHPELEALKPSEEHLPLRVHRGALPARGEALLLIPRHICPTVNLADEAVLLERGQAPRVAPISARGHGLKS